MENKATLVLGCLLIGAILVVCVLCVCLLLAGAILATDGLSDGARIAFASTRRGEFDIYVMNADGGEVACLTKQQGGAHPAWSPDGQRIAFTSRRDGNYEIYVMNVEDALRSEGADGSGVTRLTNNPTIDSEPSWSPDGKRIIFSSYRDDNWDVYVLDVEDPPRGEGADGSKVLRLTDDPAPDTNPSWSPDGRRIVFHSERDGNWEIYVLNADGSQVNLTNNPGNDWHPAWSPNGRRIAFQSARDGNWEIYVLNVEEALRSEGGGVTRLTDDPASDCYPTWSSDGRRIAFQSGRDGNWEIYVTRAPHARAGVAVPDGTGADGSGVTRLTDNPADDTDPAWSPRPGFLTLPFSLDMFQIDW